MLKLQPLILLLLFPFLTTYGQTKRIEGDTSYWLDRNEFQRILGIKDFEQSEDELSFRFWLRGQILEIIKDGSNISGTLYNYIFHEKRSDRRKRDTLSQKVILATKQARTAFEIVDKSGILNLESDDKIENWMRGMDGITYVVEHSDKNSYWVKSYWTPSSQDSIPEALILLDFIRSLEDSLQLEEKYTAFKNGLPHKGCYSPGGISQMCYIPNTLYMGYSGATRLPVGFYASYSATFIGRKEINMGFTLNYVFDKKGYYQLLLSASKWGIFFKNSDFYDFLVYKYHDRKLELNKLDTGYQNHQILYSINIKKKFGFGLGLDYLSENTEKVGGHIQAYINFSKPDISAMLTSSLIAGHLNYRVGLYKSFHFNSRFPVRNINFNLAYEDFLNYKDWYLTLLFSL